jgi:endo-1,4-beta-xylanase
MKRRDMLLGGIGLGAAFALPEILRASFAFPGVPSTSLKTIATSAGLKLGIQAGKASLQVPEFVQFITENFSLLTPGNELKWTALRPNAETYNFDVADWMIDFCQSHGLLVHGHNLCWNSPSANPAWFPSVLTHDNARQHLTDHITTVMKRYRGRIESWDIVNEPVVYWSKRPDGLYPGIWLNLLGTEYIDIAFRAAQAADPGALRVLNCYYVEQDNPDFEKTRELTLALLQQLLKRGVPIQAIGIESHLDAAAPAGGPSYLGFIEKVRAMGLQVLITELDVDDTQVSGDKRNRDNIVAQRYYDYLTEVVPAGKMNRVVFWTPSDRWNWLNSTNLPPKFRRADNQPHRPGLLDDALHQKPALDAVRAALLKLSGSKAPSSVWPIGSHE